MSILKRVSGLRWKLAVSYVGVTLVTVLALEAVVILSATWFGPRIGEAWIGRAALRHVSELAEQASDPLSMGAVDELVGLLDQPAGLVVRIVATEEPDLEEVFAWDTDARVVIGVDGIIVASNQPARYPAGEPFAEPGLLEAGVLVDEILAGGPTTGRWVTTPAVHLAAAPITGGAGEMLGAVYYRQPALNLSDWSSSYLVEPLVNTTLLLLPCIVPLGFLFGLVTATGFTRRLGRLATASRALAGGDLSRRVDDSSGDEIGQLGRQFNRMAERLESDTAQLRDLAERNARLARQTQRLAALEERHRLARDLHDGVKQHLFGVNLAAAAALNLIETDPATARQRLLEAKAHSGSAQAEMEALLNELRPAGLDERGLVAALVDYVAAFEQRQGVAVTWRAVDDLSLPLTHQQALYRIVQEALANVARHAEATRVTVELKAAPDAVTLCIRDDGKGFDPAALAVGVTMGLEGMRERLAGLGGTLTVDAALGAGTCLTARLPRPADGGESHD